MELERGVGEEIVRAISTAAEEVADVGRHRPAEQPQVRIDVETSTMLLRQCTALAARARVDLLTQSQRAAAAELAELLTTMASWSPKSLEPPDPTMTVLAAAALQDLRERLQDPAAEELIARISAVLRVLHTVMEGARIGAPA